MGLFDSIKKSKDVNSKAEWKQGLIPTVVELKDDHIRIYNSAVEDNVFYKDIMNVEVVTSIVNIKTMVKTYSLRSAKLRGGSEKARELHSQIMVKMSEHK